jgi:hypothetical protein
VVYTATLTGSGGTTADSQAIFASGFTGPSLVARTGNAAPGTEAGVNYAYFNFPPAVNDAGQLAYFAALAGAGVTNASNTAIYAGNLAGPQLVARAGNAAPGTAAGVNYSDLNFTPVINDAGQVAYHAILAGTGVTAANDDAMYVGSFVGPQLVAREGSAAPGTPAGVEYSFFNVAALNDAGQVAYRAFLKGTGITSANDRAIYAGGLGGP